MSNGSNWIEIIRVRTSAQAQEEALAALECEVAKIAASDAAAKTFIMHNAQYDGDLAVTVVWQDSLSPCKTREGVWIAELLRSYGTVNHAVWVPASSGTPREL